MGSVVLSICRCGLALYSAWSGVQVVAMVELKHEVGIFCPCTGQVGLGVGSWPRN